MNTDAVDQSSSNSATVIGNGYQIDDAEFVTACRRTLDTDGALVLDGFFPPETVAAILAESESVQDDAFFTTDTHNVYLTPSDPGLGPDHIFNRQIVSSKGCITDDQVPRDSPLRSTYDSPDFRSFLCGVLGIDEIHPYADTLSGINVHFHSDGQELGWHFDNSSFAVTMLIRAPEAGGVFEYIPGLRDADNGDMNFDGVRAALDGETTPDVLDITAGALVMFHGRDSMHRITPTEGPTTRVLVVFAYNTEPGIGLSDSAKQTFYGRLS